MSDLPPLVLERRERARLWFEALRDRICSTLETLEDDASAELYAGEAGRFDYRPWARETGSGGGQGGFLTGRLFEKAGVHISAAEGVFPPQMAQTMPGAQQNPHYVSASISLIIHPRSPKVPAAHMNTRFLSTEQGWFGGGADLNPLLDDQRHPDAPDTMDFHAALQRACDGYAPDAYARYKAWCDEYFFLPHRGEARGAGGIFYDQLSSGDFERDFAFTRAVGEAFLEVYPQIVRRRMAEPWTEAEREAQLVRRGRYVEFNLLYDRGTMFGLKMGGNIETILSSMPPVVKWP